MGNNVKNDGENSTAIPFFNRITIRFMLSVGLVMGILLAAIFLFVSNRAQDHIILEVHKQAEIAFEQVVITRHWNAEYGGVYVEKTRGIESNPYLEKLGIEPDIINVDGRKYTLKNPALMTRELSDIAKQGKVLEFHITSLDLVNPSNAPDAFEKAALMSFEKGDTEANRIVRRNALMSYQYMAPLYAEKGCLKCHKNYKPGDVRGGISVFLPMQEALSAIRTTKRNLFVAGIALILGIEILLFFLINRLIVRPMDELRAGATKIGAGDLEYRIPLKRNDEIGVVGTAFNTMASDMAENARNIAESEAKFRAIFTESLEGIALIDTESGSIFDCNPAFEQQTGRELNSLKRMKIWEIRPPEKIDKAKAKFHEIVKEGSGCSEELAFQKPDGEIVPIEFVSKMVTIQGKQYIVSSTRDLAERKQADEQLRTALQKREELEFIVNKSEVMVFLWRAAEGWPVEFVSDNIEQLGYTPEDFIEGHICYADIIHRDDLERVGAEVAMYSEQGAVEFTQEYRLVTKSGDIRWTDDITWIRRDQNGDVTHYQGIVLDVTERKKVEQELAEYRENLEKLVRERTSELEEKNEQLEQFNKLFVGRELRMAELKERIEVLEEEVAAKGGKS